MNLHCLLIRDTGWLDGGISFKWFHKKAEADKQWEESRNRARTTRGQIDHFEVRRIKIRLDLPFLSANPKRASIQIDREIEWLLYDYWNHAKLRYSENPMDWHWMETHL